MHTLQRPRRLPLVAALALIGGGVLTAAMPGCGSPEGAGAEAKVEASAPAAMATAGGQAEPGAVALPRKIIYNADVTLTADHLGDALARLTERVRKAGGYVAEMAVSGAGGPDALRTATYKVRVPTERFDAFLAGLGSLGEVRDSKTTSEDVSEEFYDLEARLRNKRAEEARLLQHLQRSTTRLSEILEVEAALSRVREEIERMEGRRRFLANQADLATITVTIQEAANLARTPAGPSLGAQARRVFAESVGALGYTARHLTLLVVAVAPWAAVGFGVGYPLWQASKRRRRGRTEAVKPQAQKAGGQ